MPLSYVGAAALGLAAGAIGCHYRRPAVPVVDIAVVFALILILFLAMLAFAYLAVIIAAWAVQFSYAQF